jgi:hypothetical protein
MALPATSKGRHEFASCDKARLKTPWQDRQTLFVYRYSPVTRDSFSPSCSWLSGVAENQ